MSTAVDTRDDTQKGGLTLWSWLRGALFSVDRRVDDDRARSIVVAAPSFASPARAPVQRGNEQRGGRENASKSGVVLRFPIHGEALLVKLADLLRERVANDRFEGDPLLLTMSRRPGSRLFIDRAAYVQFEAHRGVYHVAIETAPDTSLTLETTDFDIVVQFVVQYVTEKRFGPAAMGAAS
jgi:hypothetical protein